MKVARPVLRGPGRSNALGLPDKRTSWSSGLQVAGEGAGVGAHAGSVAVRLLADRVGLTDQLSAALQRRSFVPRHDRGRVLVDLAVMLAAGGTLLR